ncbi:L,D-transpeptidase family protein [Sulfurospirillum deleyianum]|uniref:ErfK/YbiS/YcfS/YnhG family protein n=1 Tax=Sulfurospirillum deleyianum (strain ATCC 51133 / DSM 6946 / 5175) TaxID=525898 RepID=D1AZE0_SULD5|nr:L,D-transpeptidase family protein [Sulfurospirillum deleyianum]ACZ11407.1 ErfK/YbiS/YcfS/YnhG family protein [Sulfurospirillum deleyianum DSM 6946]
MRYLVFLSLCALALYAATAEDIYRIYKTKGIDAVEDFLKQEFESKEVKTFQKPVVSKTPVEPKVIKKEPKVKVVKAKNPTEKELISKDFWLKQIRGMDVAYGYYEDLDSLIVCEKERKRCEVYRNSEDEGLELIKGHDVIMGKNGDKIKRGDLKTPVGVYEITKRFKPSDPFYGPLAFSLSYPNLFDVLRGKNGSGIWIHGMPLDGKDREDLSKGCVVMENDAIQVLDTEINANKTMTIIGENKVPPMSKEVVATLLSEVYKWQRAWKVNDINMYLNYYSNDFKKVDGSRKEQFAAMKKQIFSRKEKKTITFEHMNIAPYPTLDNRKVFKISYYQTYKSPSFASKGEKELYVELVGKKMMILAEK